MTRGYEKGVHVLLCVLGLAGVSYGENSRAQEMEGWFAWPMLLMAFWLVAQWILQSNGLISLHVANILSWLIWLAFVIETVMLTWVVDRKSRYLFNNWMNLFIILSAIPVVLSGSLQMTGMLRALRILIIPRLVINWWRR